MPDSRERVYFLPLGCPKNQVDGELMLGQASAEGHEIVDDPDRADVLVVNTCAFIEAAREESVDAILQLAARKGDRRLVVTGCMAERYREELRREIPEIDALVGTGGVGRFTEAVSGRAAAVFTDEKHYLPAAAAARRVSGHDGSAYVKVSDGCDHECSFCVIPTFRGKHRSRPIDDVAAEVEGLVAAGVVEVNLVAQDLSAYGRDRGDREGLAALLARLGRIGGLARVRCLYLYPSTLTDEALAAINEIDAVVPYIDIPLQHADGEVLRRMRRARDTGQIERILERVRSAVDDAYVRTSFIVGFPGETDAAFARLRSFVESSEFDRIAVFAYSPEEDSGAAGLDGGVDATVASDRRDELLALQEPISGRRLAGRVGGTEKVLVTGRDDGGSVVGRTPRQAPEIDGVTFLGSGVDAPPGTIVTATVTGSDDYDLFAEVSHSDSY